MSACARSSFIARASDMAGIGAAVLFVASLTLILHGQQQQPPPPRQSPPQTQKQQIPTFRAEANLVRVDAYVSAEGRAVEDLRAGDFEVLEDNVRQKVETFEYIRKGQVQVLTGRPLGEPETRGRLFVLFVDTYHLPWVDRDRMEHRERTVPKWEIEPLRFPVMLPPPVPDDGMLRTALKEVVGRVMSDDDRVAVLTPDMWAASLTFMEKGPAIEELATRSFKPYVTGQRPPELNRFEACFPPGPDVEFEMRERYRLYRTFTALQELVANLELVRDDRKALLLVTRGWDPPPRIRNYRDPREGNFFDDWTVCHGERLALADRDFDTWLRTIINDAKRSNVAFYSIYAHPLVTYKREGASIDEDTARYQRQWGESQRDQMMSRRQRQPGEQRDEIDGARMLYDEFPAILHDRNMWHDTLTHLSKDTNGRAILTADDFDKGLKDIADTLSSYYLLGYYSTNTKRDGTFRRITVNVKRKGVTVRARSGYRAVIPAELEAAELAARPDAVPAPVTAALAPLARLRSDVPFHLAVSPEWDQGVGGWRVRIVGEIDGEQVRAPEWRNGWRAELTVTTGEGTAAGTETLPVKSGQASFSVLWPGAGTVTAGDYEVRAKVFASDETVFDERTRVAVPAAAGANQPLLGRPLLSRRLNAPRTEFQPTADQRFNRRQILLLEVPVAGAVDAPVIHLVDRQGKPLGGTIPAALVERNGGRLVSVTIVLSNVAPGDYVIEVAASEKGDTKLYVAFRVVP